MGNVAVYRTIKVPLKKVWAVAGDFTKSPVPSWPIEIINQGDESNLKIGCERLVKEGNKTYHERLLSVNPPYSFTYEMLSGAPLKSYLGKVMLQPEGDTTHVTWSADIEPKIPGTGWIVKLVLKKSFNRFIDELENIK